MIYEEKSWSMLFDEFMIDLNQQIYCESGSLFLFDKENETLKEVATIGEGIDFIGKVNFPMGNGLSAWVAQKGKCVYLPDIHRGSRHGLNPMRSYLSIPLEVNNKILGVLNLGHVFPNAFKKTVRVKIDGLCKDISRKIYNKRYLALITNEEKDLTN